MRIEKMAAGFVLAALGGSLGLGACQEFECGYGGPGCSDPIVAGLCEGNTLVVGQEYMAVFGYGSDTGLSEATLVAVSSSAPDTLEVAPIPGSPDINLMTGPNGAFDGNNGPGDGGISLHPKIVGTAQVTITLKDWDEPRTMTFTVVDEAHAPEGFMVMNVSDRFAKCVDVTASVP